MSLLEAFILGIVQGITEFFPVSSSAHLLLAKKFLGLSFEKDHFFDLVCHMGTLLALLVFFRKELLPTFLNIRQCSLFFVALLPLFPLYFLGKPYIDALSSTSFLPLFFLISALLLFFSGKLKEKEEKGPQKFRDVLLIGTMQAMALLPGISRSGSTIAGGLFRGWKLSHAIRFSYFLAIPTVGGGMLLECIQLGRHAMHFSFPVYLTAFFSSWLFGSLSIQIFFTLISRKMLQFIALYLAFLSLISYFW